jgi:hypothetical protein
VAAGNGAYIGQKKNGFLIIRGPYSWPRLSQPRAAHPHLSALLLRAAVARVAELEVGARCSGGRFCELPAGVS